MILVKTRSLGVWGGNNYCDRVTFIFNQRKTKIRSVNINMERNSIDFPDTIEKLFNKGKKYEDINISEVRISFNEIALFHGPKVISMKQILMGLLKYDARILTRSDYEKYLTFSRSMKCRKEKEEMISLLPKYIFTDEFDQEIARRFIYFNSRLVSFKNFQRIFLEWVGVSIK
jgi:hypothetical protein